MPLSQSFWGFCPIPPRCPMSFRINESCDSEPGVIQFSLAMLGNVWRNVSYEGDPAIHKSAPPTQNCLAQMSLGTVLRSPGHEEERHGFPLCQLPCSQSSSTFLTWHIGVLCFCMRFCSKGVGFSFCFQETIGAPEQQLTWFEQHPAHQKVAGLIPGQGGYRKQPVGVSLSLSLPCSLKINKFLQ